MCSAELPEAASIAAARTSCGGDPSSFEVWSRVVCSESASPARLKYRMSSTVSSARVADADMAVDATAAWDVSLTFISRLAYLSDFFSEIERRKSGPRVLAASGRIKRQEIVKLRSQSRRLADYRASPAIKPRLTPTWPSFPPSVMTRQHAQHLLIMLPSRLAPVLARPSISKGTYQSGTTFIGW